MKKNNIIMEVQTTASTDNSPAILEAKIIHGSTVIFSCTETALDEDYLKYEKSLLSIFLEKIRFYQTTELFQNKKIFLKLQEDMEERFLGKNIRKKYM